MTIEHFTAISLQYDPIYIIAEPESFTYINVNKNALIHRVIELDDVCHVEFNIHGDIVFGLKDFEMDRIEFKSIFQSELLRYLHYSKQEAANFTVFDFTTEFLVVNKVEVEVPSGKSEFTLNSSVSCIFEICIGQKRLTFDFETCKIHCLEREHFVLQDDCKKLKFQSLESFEKTFLLASFFRAKVLYYEVYLKQYNEKNKLLEQQAEDRVRNRLRVQELDFEDDVEPIEEPRSIVPFDKNLGEKKAVRSLELLIQDIETSQNRRLGGVLEELLVLEGKLLVEQTKKQEGHIDVIKGIDEALEVMESKTRRIKRL